MNLNYFNYINLNCSYFDKYIIWPSTLITLITLITSIGGVPGGNKLRLLVRGLNT